MKIQVVNVKGTGQKIKAVMESRGKTTKDIQRACGFTTPQAIYGWFKGTRLPCVDSLVIIASILDAKLDELVATDEIEI